MSMHEKSEVDVDGTLSPIDKHRSGSLSPTRNGPSMANDSVNDFVTHGGSSFEHGGESGLGISHGEKSPLSTGALASNLRSHELPRAGYETGGPISFELNPLLSMYEDSKAEMDFI